MSFTLPDEIVLLGLDDGTGKCVSQYSDYAFAAAVLAELAILGRIDPRDAVLVVRDQAPTGNDVLDEAVRSIAGHSRRLSQWIRHGLSPRGRDRVLERLVQVGILERNENRVLGLFTFRRYPAHDGAVEAAIRYRLRSILLSGKEPDVRSTSLLSLTRGAGLLKVLLSPEEQAHAEHRLQVLTDAEPVGAALTEVIESDEAASTAAIITASIT